MTIIRFIKSHPKYIRRLNQRHMKKIILFSTLLVTSFITFSQDKPLENSIQKWKARLRVVAVIPPSSSYDLSGSDVTISTAVVPELDFTYFFTQNLAAELILGTTRHTVKLKNNGNSATLGKVWLLPPTLNLQYHFPSPNFTPYIGAGINYTIFYGAKDEGASLGYKNKAGFSTQLGFDVNLNKKWFLNFDVKKIFLKTDVTLKGTPSVVLSDVKINPFVIGLGIGTRF